MKIIASGMVAAAYGDRIRAVDAAAEFVVPALVDGEVSWSGDPAGADVLCFSEDFWHDVEARRRVIPLLFGVQGLRWFHTFSAGTDSPAFAAIIERGTVLTNSAGASAPSIAQYVLAMMLSRAKRLDELRDQQRRREWTQLPGRDLTGLTAGIIGLGAIGGEVARLAKAFNMRVIGARRSQRRARYVDEQVALGGLDRLVRESDFVVIACPLTRETEGMIGEPELRSMKPTATLINVARGRIVDEDALVRALQDGVVAGASLDVFVAEPLPETSPLWDMPNVSITPHNSGISPHNMERAMGIFIDNLGRLIDGRPMRNRIRVAGR